MKQWQENLLCFGMGSLDVGGLQLANQVFWHIQKPYLIGIEIGSCLLIGIILSRIFILLQRRRLTRKLPLDQWVEIVENTRLMRHPDGTTTYESTLNKDHPTATWT